MPQDEYFHHAHYLRAHVPGGAYFFTVALLERRRRLLTAHIDALRAAFRSVHTQRPFRIDAIVILPDHDGPDPELSWVVAVQHQRSPVDCAVPARSAERF